MTLKIQIYSLCFSFLYGMVIYYIFLINDKFLYSGKIGYRISISLFLIIDISLLYFIILKYINDGILHFYFLLCILTGYTFSMFMRKFICKKKNRVI